MRNWTQGGPTGSTPHSYVVLFSAEGFLGLRSHDVVSVAATNSAPITTNAAIMRWSKPVTPV